MHKSYVGRSRKSNQRQAFQNHHGVVDHSWHALHQNPCTSSFTELIPRYLCIRLRTRTIGHRRFGERSHLYRSHGSRTKPPFMCIDNAPAGHRSPKTRSVEAQRRRDLRRRCGRGSFWLGTGRVTKRKNHRMDDKRRYMRMSSISSLNLTERPFVIRINMTRSCLGKGRATNSSIVADHPLRGGKAVRMFTGLMLPS